MTTPAQGGSLKVFPLPFFCALTECPEILTLQSRHVSGPGKLEIIKKSCRSSEIQPRKVGGIGKFWGFCPWKSLKTHRGIPLYTPYRSRKYTFSDHEKHFTGLENAFAGTARSWKPHKWKEHNFLHRNYTPKIFSTSKKNQIFFRSNFFSDFFSTKKFSRKIGPKIENFRFSIFGLIFRENVFVEKKSGFFSIEKISEFFRSWEKNGGIVSM